MHAKHAVAKTADPVWAHTPALHSSLLLFLVIPISSEGIPYSRDYKYPSIIRTPQIQVPIWIFAKKIQF